MFTSFITRLIRKFYLLIVQLTLMKCIQKCVMHLQCCCLAYSPIVVVVFFLTFSLLSTSWFMMTMATTTMMIIAMMTLVVIMNGLNFVGARFD